MIENQTRVYIPVTEVFPQLKSNISTLRNLLHDLSLTDTVFWCARLNLIISSSSNISHVERQAFAIKRFFRPETIRNINNFVSKNGGPDNVYVFFRGQILELLRWVVLYCHNHQDDGTTFENQDLRCKFGQAAMIAGDLFGRRVYGKNFTIDNGIETARKRALGPIRQAAEATVLAPELYKALGRGKELWGTYFLKYYVSTEEKFLNATGLTIKEYFRCWCSIAIQYMEMEQNNETRIFDSITFADTTKYKNIFQKYIDLESQNTIQLQHSLWKQHASDNLIDDYNLPTLDYNPLRQKPIFRANDSRAVILDPIFYSTKPMVGPLFLLAAKYPQEQNEIFSAFGMAFEDYSCDILNRMYPQHNDVLAKRLSCRTIIMDNSKTTFEIDACLNDVKEVILFEMKAVWILEKKIALDNHEEYLQHLRERYCGSKPFKRKRKYKGVSQLARIINILASVDNENLNLEFKSAEIIYPVLIVHDPFIDAPLYGSFLADEFKISLSPDSVAQSGVMKKGKLSIVPLIVMTIEELENLEKSVEKFSLSNLLSDYSLSQPDRIVSLHNFIAYSKYANLMLHNPNLHDRAMELIDDTRRNIY